MCQIKFDRFYRNQYLHGGGATFQPNHPRRFLMKLSKSADQMLEDAFAEDVCFCRNEKLAELFMRLHWMKKSGQVVRSGERVQYAITFVHCNSSTL